MFRRLAKLCDRQSMMTLPKSVEELSEAEVELTSVETSNRRSSFLSMVFGGKSLSASGASSFLSRVTSTMRRTSEVGDGHGEDGEDSGRVCEARNSASHVAGDFLEKLLSQLDLGDDKTRALSAALVDIGAGSIPLADVSDPRIISDEEFRAAFKDSWDLINKGELIHCKHGSGAEETKDSATPVLDAGDIIRLRDAASKEAASFGAFSDPMRKILAWSHAPPLNDRHSVVQSPL